MGKLWADIGTNGKKVNSGIITTTRARSSGDNPLGDGYLLGNGAKPLTGL